MALSEGALRYRGGLFGAGFLGSLVSVTLGGAFIAAVSALLGSLR
jgi:hypothetical protein